MGLRAHDLTRGDVEMESNKIYKYHLKMKSRLCCFSLMMKVGGGTVGLSQSQEKILKQSILEVSSSSNRCQRPTSKEEEEDWGQVRTKSIFHYELEEKSRNLKKNYEILRIMLK